MTDLENIDLSTLTPAMKQYVGIKKQYIDYLIFTDHNQRQHPDQGAVFD